MNLFTKQTNRLRKQSHGYQWGAVGGEEWIDGEFGIDTLRFQRDCLATGKGTTWLAQQWLVAPAQSVELSPLFVVSLNQGFILTDHIPTF